MLHLLLALLAMQPAHAGVSVTLSSPGVEVVVDPFTPTYAPPPRPGYVWVPGHYDEYGFFVPGYWSPVEARPGFYWVPGYWAGSAYYDGYWRPIIHGDDVWVDGYYVEGRYVAPRWVARSQADAARREAAHEREEAHERAEGHGHSQPPPHDNDHGHERPHN